MGRLGTACAALLLLVSCGKDEERGREPVPPPQEAQEERDACADLAERLDRTGSEAPEGDEALHRDASRCFEQALAREDLEAAVGAREVLVRTFGGRMRVGGSYVEREVVDGALIDVALEVARARIEGVRPDAAGARAAWEVASRLAAALDRDMVPDLGGPLVWIGSERVEDLGLDLAPHEGARVVVVADDFQLGEPYLLPVLRRWASEGEPGGLRVGLVAVLDGSVRSGIRREPASPGEERAALEALLEGTGVHLEPGFLDAEGMPEGLGLAPAAAAVVVVDREGRILARLSGPNLDPRGVEPIVERVASR